MCDRRMKASELQNHVKLEHIDWGEYEWNQNIWTLVTKISLKEEKNGFVLSASSSSSQSTPPQLPKIKPQKSNIDTEIIDMSSVFTIQTDIIEY